MNSPLIRFTTLISTIFLSGCYDSFDTPEVRTDQIPTSNITIATLKEAYRGKTIQISQYVVVNGYVTSSDKEDNFYNSIVIQDNSGAIELMTGVASSYVRYPLGCLVAVKLQGLALGQTRGICQVGLMPAAYEYSAVAYISSSVLLDKHLWCGDELKTLIPRQVSIDELTEACCGELVEIADVVYTPLLADEPTTWSGYKHFVDVQGESIYVYTSPYATYANHDVPQGVNVSLVGIMQYGKIEGGQSGFTIKFRGEDDCIR